MTRVSIVVPLYNEEEMLPLFMEKSKDIFVSNDKYVFDITFVNDGSKDKTLELLHKIVNDHPNVSYLSFSRNFGQDAALEAGLRAAKGDVVIPMDCDLQDPPSLIPQMLKKYEEGYDVVNPRRIKRDGDNFMKKTTSGMFYRFINKISGREVIPENVSQFRLISRRALNKILSMPEKIRLLRSEVPYVGFKTCYIPFERQNRGAGKTKYNYKKIFNLAGHTIASTTDAILNWPLLFGIGFGAVSGLGWIATLVLYILALNNIEQYGLIFLQNTETWLIITTILVAVAIISLLLFIPCLYIKNIVINIQGRPTYIVEEEYHPLEK